MKLALVSDLHFGAPTCALVEPGRTTPFFERLKEAAGEENNFLILAGDVFDFSISSYQEAYNAGRPFFEALHQGNLAAGIIYLPGNHDHDFWHMSDYEINVIKKIRDGQPPASLFHSLPGVLDDRSDSPQPGLSWPTIELHCDLEARRPGRDGLFLDRFFPPAGDGLRRRFWLCYPNLYICSEEGTILVSHGHYLSSFWALTAELSRYLAPEIFDQPNHPNEEGWSNFESKYDRYASIEDIVAVNHPLNQLSCSGIGQAGPLTHIVREIQAAAKQKDPGPFKKYFNLLPNAIIRTFHLDKYKGLPLRAGMEVLEPLFLAAITGYEDARYNQRFLAEPGVERRFVRYYLASCMELYHINQDEPFNKRPIPYPSRIIFGHTHVPIGWNRAESFSLPPLPLKGLEEGIKISIANTGGWLKECRASAAGAEVFTYSTAHGWNSASVPLAAAR